MALERGGESGGGERAPPKARSAPPACWHMQGRLTDAATGQTIALVEGVEMARSISFETASPRKSAGGKRRERFGGDRGPAGGGGGGGEGEAEGEEEELEVDKELKPGRWTAFGALASSKFFMYQVRAALRRSWGPRRVVWHAQPCQKGVCCPSTYRLGRPKMGLCTINAPF